MKIAILGATGMIGHRIWIDLQKDFEVIPFYRRNLTDVSKQFSFLTNSSNDNTFDALDFNRLKSNLSKLRPDVVINCVGIVKQLDASKKAVPSIELNSLFPHKLAELTGEIGARQINFSSDCVFDGKDGNYTEESIPNATDLYGKSKALGEVTDLEHVLTLRTSFIGREIFPHGGLLEWFLSQSGKEISGYSKAFYTGLTTYRFSEILKEYILPNHKLCGLLHLSGNKISKFDLLQRMSVEFSTNNVILENNSVKIDRSLDSKKFRELTGFIPPTWDELIHDIWKDFEFYEKLRKGK